MDYILKKILSWNIQYEKVSDDCMRIYGNFDGFSIVRNGPKGYVDVDGKLMDYADFEDWLYQIKL